MLGRFSIPDLDRLPICHTHLIPCTILIKLLLPNWKPYFPYLSLIVILTCIHQPLRKIRFCDDSLMNRLDRYSLRLATCLDRDDHLGRCKCSGRICHHVVRSRYHNWCHSSWDHIQLLFCIRLMPFFHRVVGRATDCLAQENLVPSRFQ